MSDSASSRVARSASAWVLPVPALASMTNPRRGRSSVTEKERSESMIIWRLRLTTPGPASATRFGSSFRLPRREDPRGVRPDRPPRRDLRVRPARSRAQEIPCLRRRGRPTGSMFLEAGEAGRPAAGSALPQVDVVGEIRKERQWFASDPLRKQSTASCKDSRATIDQVSGSPAIARSSTSAGPTAVPRLADDGRPPTLRRIAHHQCHQIQPGLDPVFGLELRAADPGTATGRCHRARVAPSPRCGCRLQARPRPRTARPAQRRNPISGAASTRASTFAAIPWSTLSSSAPGGSDPRSPLDRSPLLHVYALRAVPGASGHPPATSGGGRDRPAACWRSVHPPRGGGLRADGRRSRRSDS